jgi:hypothetical protein
MTKVNLGVFTEIATEKADRDLRNVDLTKTDVVIEYQEPTEKNGYTWYRLYATGWVEQGGFSDTTSGTVNITLPIVMADSDYSPRITQSYAPSDTDIRVRYIQRCTTTTIYTSSVSGVGFYWQVSGKADMTGHEVLPSKKAIDEYDHRVIEFQKPTATNNYTWYRKYADGWVEQGGIDEGYTQGGGGSRTISLLIPMQDNFYNICCQKTTVNDSGQMSIQTFDLTYSEFKWSVNYGASQQSREIRWQVSGMAAE